MPFDNEQPTTKRRHSRLFHEGKQSFPKAIDAIEPIGQYQPEEITRARVQGNDRFEKVEAKHPPKKTPKELHEATLETAFPVLL